METPKPLDELLCRLQEIVQVDYVFDEEVLVITSMCDPDIEVKATMLQDCDLLKVWGYAELNTFDVVIDSSSDKMGGLCSLVASFIKIAEP